MIVLSPSEGMDPLASRVAHRWIRVASPSIMYHTTTEENAEAILRDGLKPRSRGGYTSEYGDAQLMSYYPKRPAFLGVKPWPKSGRWNAVLKINVSGIPLAADIPTVAEEVGLYWGGLVLDEVNAEGESTMDHPPPERARKLLGPIAHRNHFTKGGYEVVVRMEDLAKAGSPAAKAAIKLTGTAAVYDTIPAKRITRV